MHGTTRASLNVVTALGALVVLGAHARAQTFRSAVNLVIVPVSVSDPSGQFVGDLARSDFAIYEDGAERPIVEFSSERTPVSLGALIDISGSMAGTRFADAREAMARIAARLTPEDRVFLATFNETFTLVAPWTTDRDAPLRALASVKPAGGTFLYRALSSALPLLDQERSRKKTLVLISDGDDNEKPGGAVNREGLARVVAQARASDAAIYAIAIGDPRPDADELARQLSDPVMRRKLLYDPPIDVEQLKRLTDPTGGYTQLVPTSATLSLMAIRVVDDVSRQYVLGFEPGSPDGKSHALRVVVRNNSTLKVRARTDYVASPPRP